MNVLLCLYIIYFKAVRKSQEKLLVNHSAVLSLLLSGVTRSNPSLNIQLNRHLKSHPVQKTPLLDISHTPHKFTPLSHRARHRRGVQGLTDTKKACLFLLRILLLSTGSYPSSSIKVQSHSPSSPFFNMMIPFFFF